MLYFISWLCAALLDAKLCKHYQPVTVSPLKYLNMSTDMKRFVFGPDSVRYLREVGVMILHEQEMHNTLLSSFMNFHRFWPFTCDIATILVITFTFLRQCWYVLWCHHYKSLPVCLFHGCWLVFTLSQQVWAMSLLVCCHLHLLLLLLLLSWKVDINFIVPWNNNYEPTSLGYVCLSAVICINCRHYIEGL